MENYEWEPHNEHIHLLERWLSMPRDDGKPRVLIFPIFLTSNVLRFIDHIKMQFSTAKRPCSFFIRLFVVDCRHIYNSGEVEWHHDSCGENGETKEKLVIKMVALTDKLRSPRKVVLISRYPLSVGKNWIEANEREALDWDFDEQNRKIHMDNPIQNAIPNSFEHSSEGREIHYRNIRLCDCPSSSANDGRGNQGRCDIF